MKIKESEKREKFLDLAGEQGKLLNIRVTMILIVIGSLGTVSKGLERGLQESGIRGRIETNQTIALLRLASVVF